MYRFHQDPGHGWIEVPMSEIRELGIADKISTYSYQSRDGRIAYLEEDCDAGEFINARKLQRSEVEDVHYNHEVFIRALPRFQVSA